MSLQRHLKNSGFEQLFQRAFVYNILFEDTEVDERFLGLDERSRILAISGAGCGVANYVSQRPRRVDAIDINPHHLALTALKASAAQSLQSHEELYSMFGLGLHPNPKQITGKLTETLPRWIQRYWQSHHRVFRRSMIQAGMTARLLGLLRALSGIDTQWLRNFISQTVEQRYHMLEESVFPVFEKPLVKLLINSPVQLIALGVNFSQKDRLLRTEGTDLTEFFCNYIRRIACTDLERNWFAWYAAAGHFNHDIPDAVPPYVRADHHERSCGSDTVMNYQRENIFKVLERGAPNSWTHYTFCDAPDWMSDEAQLKLFKEVLRTSQDGGRLLYRSVEDHSLIEKHGLGRHFQLDNAASDRASELDRTRQYRRVNFYTICH
ncbi:MAG: DUF3419 family protein [Myxococcota bacterium]